jgi:hypothetical protein
MQDSNTEVLFLFLRLAVGLLSTWRISVILWYERGLYGVVADLRDYVYHRSLPTMKECAEDHGEFYLEHDIFFEIVHSQLSCLWCVSLWVGIIVTGICLTRAWLFLIPFALSGGAMILSGGSRTIWRATTDAGERRNDD